MTILHIFRAMICAASALAATLIAQASPPPAVTLRQVASGLSSPVELATAHDGSGRLFIVEKGGRIKILQNGTVLPTLFLNISTLVSTSGERGLLGLAFDPAYAGTRRFFVLYTRAADGALVLASYEASSADPNVADAASAVPLMIIPHPGADNHNGGKIAFGPDGFLYIAVGDGGGGGDSANNAQNLNTQLGKLLRVDVTSTPGSVFSPASNPFVGVAGARSDIWAYGLRNPWKFSFDRMTGDLYIGDVGQDVTEEINFQPAGAAGGQNYGWRVFEGSGCYTPPSGCSLANHTLPVLTYPHTAAGGESITGGYVYRGLRSAALRGYYIYGDFISNRVWAAHRENGTWHTHVLIEPGGALSGLSSFGQDETGELYVVSFSTGRIHIIEGPGPGFSTRSDFSGDGKGDLVFRQPSTGAHVAMLMNGLNVLDGDYLLGEATPWQVVTTGDLDGDGRADIIFRNTDGSHVAWFMNGLTQTSAGYLIGANTGFEVAHAGDLNGDGKADLIWHQPNTGAYVGWLMDGLNILSAEYLIGGGTPWRITLVGDINGDGKTDLVFKNTVDQSHVAWFMNGLTQASAGYLIGTNTGFDAVNIGDLNGDGKADLIWRGSNNEFVGWLMSGLAILDAQYLVGSGTPFSVVNLSDLNGDGKMDIVFRHTDGSHVAWFMNGLVQISAGYLLGANTGFEVLK
jgi:glucose/arabinose dehydrogenase